MGYLKCVLGGYMKRWTVCNMPDETIAAIKNRAIDYGCSIPEVLADAFGQEANCEVTKAWKLKNVPLSTRKKLTKRAMQAKMPIAKVLEDLLDVKQDAEIERNVRGQVAAEVRGYLKKFVKKVEYC